MRVGLLQLNVNDDPADNLQRTLDLMRQAVADGAQWVLTPECTNLLSSSGAHQRATIRSEDSDETLATLRAQAARAGVWLLIGSLGIATQDADGRFANRSFLIGPDGGIVARYDKIHMFDVNVSATEVYRESAAYRPGARAVLADMPFGKLGMAVCYDLRFPHLFRALAKQGAKVLSVPAAFNDQTGAAHWHVLLRARAIENGAWVLAPAQTGFHPEREGKGRRTFGHSLVVAPWGEVVADGGTEPGIVMADLDMKAVTQARHRVPALWHDRGFGGPDA